MMKKLLFAFFAAALIVSCAKNEVIPENPTVDGELACLQVNFKDVNSLVKSAPGTFDLGTAAERAVKTVTFWFFDANGGQFAVNGTENYLTGNVSVWTEQSKGSTVSDISGMVLVVKRLPEGDPVPTQMVAVLNAPKDVIKSMSLRDFEALDVTELTSDDAFIMSNSVYYDNNGQKAVKTTPINENNFFTANLQEGTPGYNAPGTIVPENAATGINPVNVYVERVAARVKVTGIDGVLPVMNNEQEQFTDAQKNPVYIKVLGWNITNNTDKAKALKVVENYSNLGFEWNNAAAFRSYWATTDALPLHNLTFNDLISNDVPSVGYYFENTGAYAENNKVSVQEKYGESEYTFVTAADANKASQLLIAAQLCDNQGNPITLAKWYDELYTLEGIKAAMVSSVAHKLYKLSTSEENGETTNTWTSITEDDIDFVQEDHTAEAGRYFVYATVKSGVKYYAKESTTEMSSEDADAILKAIQPALIWKDGYTYYYSTIEHFEGTVNGSVQKNYGVVRNHSYEVEISAVKGLGTPVYNPDMVITPEKPAADPEATNLVATINIQSWAVVSNSIVLE